LIKVVLVKTRGAAVAEGPRDEKWSKIVIFYYATCVWCPCWICAKMLSIRKLWSPYRLSCGVQCV